MTELDLPRDTYMASLVLLQARGCIPATVLDIGAAEAGFFLGCRTLNLFSSARYFFIDAMWENEEIYRRLAAKCDVGYEITALSCMEGQVSIRIDPEFYNTHIDYLQPGTGYESTRQVRVTTLDNVVKRHGLKAPFALKLDVQGGELDVLRGSLRTLEQAFVVTAEIQIFSERDTLVELLSFMQGVGWALFDLTDFAYYRSNNALYQCYATFIPRQMDFRKGEPWCLPDQKPALLEFLRLRRKRNLEAIDQFLLDL